MSNTESTATGGAKASSVAGGAKATRRPPIHMIDNEADSLTGLAIGAEERLPQVSELLMTEIARAHIHSADKMPVDVVRMQSTVEFTDGTTGARRQVKLVYPREADIEAGRISILTPIGAGLIGLREGQSIIWPDRGGKERTLTIEKVSHED
ncbi:MAG: nucleoside diphosphate kinase regulator [Sphingobium sp.]|nr:nucleoside diphosphate kinase regulator [Sphingobium sp.]